LVTLWNIGLQHQGITTRSPSLLTLHREFACDCARKLAQYCGLARKTGKQHKPAVFADPPTHCVGRRIFQPH
jgi:hypothetical protein